MQGGGPSKSRLEEEEGARKDVWESLLYNAPRHYVGDLMHKPKKNKRREAGVWGK